LILKDGDSLLKELLRRVAYSIIQTTKSDTQSGRNYPNSFRTKITTRTPFSAGTCGRTPQPPLLRAPDAAQTTDATAV